MILIYVILGALTALSYIAQMSLKNQFKKYSGITMNYNMTGRDVALQMLRDNDIHDVSVKEVNGMLTDHYNPVNKTLNLSHDVFHGTSVAAAAVAAHECGHAVQHATAYAWLSLRSKMVPAVNVSNFAVPWILLLGVILVQKFPTLLLAGIILFGVTTLFSLVTLPVEIDASKRALVWLNTHNITSTETHGYAEKALRTAAYTYVIAALSSLATLVYYLLIFLGNKK